MTQIEYDNVHRYLKPPSLAEVDAFIKELGVSDSQFERFYRMPKKTISRIRAQQINLQKKYWHYIYEKIVPQYTIPYTKKKVVDSTKISTKRNNDRKVVNVNRLTDL